MFKYAGRWMRGKLDAEVALKWARKAWEADWRPSAKGAPNKEPEKKQKVRAGVPVVTVADFLAESEDAAEDWPAQPDSTHEIEEEDELHRFGERLAASTAVVERAFSEVTGMHSDLRKSLKEGTIQHSLMAAMN
ncbi:hypothetical protein CYMTET_34476 [Cymbomonas tetramitiformis]|uniref:Uncharacterized protein n=1 Tax=Cymbomonas tetramitiformis TaxID=36881 RepID=A0AAE0FB40_9CHLO|nr:hypothetical protein CYMTET_34476 [Cymbomonas tetramitiformis]